MQSKPPAKYREIIIDVLDKNWYLKNPIEVGLDEDWANKSKYFDRSMKAQGVYIIHVPNPPRIIHVGKTRGPTMDFATRLYRHCVKSASGDYPKVYRALKRIKEETGDPILVSLIPSEQIRDLFRGEKLEDAAIIDIYEQVLIHLLAPKIPGPDLKNGWVGKT